MFQFPFRCIKLKCGDIWAFVVTSASVPPLGASLVEEPSRGGRYRVAAWLQLSLVLRAFCAIGAVLASQSRRGR